MSAAFIILSGQLATVPIYERLPPVTVFSPITALTPIPERVSYPSVERSSIPSSRARLTTACPRGCSLFASRDAARVRSSRSSTPSDVYISVTLIFPSVTVPVLSRTAILHLPAASSDAAVLKSIPPDAPLALPAITATGVASPSAQGQLITSTDMANFAALPTSPVHIIHIAKVRSAIAITAGTNTPATRSAAFATGAFVVCTSFTVLIISARAVFPEVLTARQRAYPERTLEGQSTLSPSPRSTGSDSPVSADSSRVHAPSVITPSTGTVSPARRTNTSSTSTESAGTVTSPPSRRTVAVFGASAIREDIASATFPLERDSRVLPTVISATIIAADSKYRL